MEAQSLCVMDTASIRENLAPADGLRDLISPLLRHGQCYFASGPLLACSSLPVNLMLTLPQS